MTPSFQNRDTPSDLEKLIGNTPMVRLRSIPEFRDVTIYSKLEGRNPGGSVKDRAAYGMITAALERGDIRSGDKLVEATSGNTGIALAMIARLKDLKMKLIMPESATKERIQTMRAYGAEVILTPAEKNMEYARTVADEMASSGEYYQLNQFANPDNYRIHYRTTGPEIWNDTNGNITHFVSSMGTTGTIMGVSRYLKEKNPDIQIIGVQPAAESQIPGIRRWPPEFLPEIFEPERVDRVIDVSRKEAIHITRRMAHDEAIFAGMSSGGCLSAALKLADELDHGIMVCITCDIGDRYLSSPLFEETKSF